MESTILSTAMEQERKIVDDIPPTTFFKKRKRVCVLGLSNQKCHLDLDSLKEHGCSHCCLGFLKVPSIHIVTTGFFLVVNLCFAGCQDGKYLRQEWQHRLKGPTSNLAGIKFWILLSLGSSRSSETGGMLYPLAASACWAAPRRWQGCYRQGGS